MIIPIVRRLNTAQKKAIMMKIISKIAYILFSKTNTLYFGFARSEFDNIDCTFFSLSFVSEMPDTSYSIICEETRGEKGKEDKGTHKRKIRK